MVGCICSIGIARVMDKFKRKFKLVLVCATVCTGVLFGIMGAIQEDYIHIPSQYATGK